MSAVDPTLAVGDFDYDLPPELIAQTPLAARDGSRLMVVERGERRPRHKMVTDLPLLLSAGDLVVVNNTRVVAARLTGRRASGAAVEFLLLRKEGDRWIALARPAKRLRVAEVVPLEHSGGEGTTGLAAQLTAHLGEGLVELTLSERAEAELGTVGSMPLPPYIRERLADPERYQTVFASTLGSAAAPTAGLHLTHELLDRLRVNGVRVGEVTLHVGLDTFRPMAVERVADHVIHTEWCEVSADVARLIKETRRAGGRVVAIGTTTARTLETLGRQGPDALQNGWSGFTDIYITPGYRWTVVDGLLTNFHLPRSTLLMMVSALAGSEPIRAVYREAVAERYRFFSFGDAMLIL